MGSQTCRILALEIWMLFFYWYDLLNLWWLLLSTWEDHLREKLLGVSVRDFLVSFTLSGKTLQLSFGGTIRWVCIQNCINRRKQIDGQQNSLSSYSYNVTSLLRWTVVSSWWPGYNVSLALTNVSLTESPDSQGACAMNFVAITRKVVSFLFMKKKKECHVVVAVYAS